MKSLSTLIFVSSIFAVPVQKVNVQTQVPAAGEVLSGANVATATVFSQTGDPSSQITAQKGQNALTAVRNFLGDVQMVSNALNLIGSGQVTDPATISTLAQVAFNAEINENEQRQILVAAAGQAGAEANSNILTFTPTVLNGLQAIASNPNQNAQQLALMMGTVRDARILPSISNLATAALGNVPVNSIIQATIQQSTANNGNPQNLNSAFLLGTQGKGASGKTVNQKSNSNNNQAGNNSSGDQGAQSSNNRVINDGVNLGGDGPHGNQASRIVGISSSTQDNGNGNENAAQGVTIAKNSNGKQNSKPNSSANKSADAQSNTKGIGNKSNSNSNSASRKSPPPVASSTGHTAGQNAAKGKKRAPSPNL